MKNKIPESSVKRAVAQVLQILQNQKRICWFTRLNSGSVIGRAKGRTWKIQLAPEGSPDFVGFTSKGMGFAVECKGSGGKLAQTQIRVLSNMLEAGVIVRVVDESSKNLIGMLED